MRLTWIRGAALLSALSMFTACSSGSTGSTNGSTGSSSGSTGGSSGSSGSTGGMALGDFCSQLVGDLTGLLSTCAGGPRDLWGIDLDTPVDFCDALSRSVAAGRAHYDPSHAQACLAAVVGESCAAIDSSYFDSPDCHATIAGTVATGGACYSGDDCAADAYCTDDTATCPGVCKPKVAAGAACAAGDTCVEDGTCTNSVCTPKVHNRPGSGSACDASTGCQPGLACDAVTGVCAAIVQEGNACQFGHRTCEVFTSCGSAGTCVRWGAAGAFCGTSVGAAGSEVVGCIPGSYCKGPTGQQTGTCAANLPAGATCNDARECDSGACTAGTCAAVCLSP